MSLTELFNSNSRNLKIKLNNQNRKKNSQKKEYLTKRINSNNNFSWNFLKLLVIYVLI